MSQRELERAVAVATGESVVTIHELGFGLADGLDVDFDPEPRRPMMLDWDSFLPVEWPYL